MNKQQLASKIWSGANDLRGKVSASNYKDYMLGFIFYKYLSNKEEKYLREKLYFTDKELEKLDENDLDTVNNCQENIGYFISYDNLFSTWISNGNDFKIKDVRVALSAFNRKIGKNHKKVYDGIFDTLEKGLDSLGAGDSERSKAVRKLINLIKEIPTEESQKYDVLGFVYEFLLKNFAANAGKAGEFYTPYEASYMMSEIIANHLKDKKTVSIYDPTSGSGSLLINIGKTLSKHMESSNKIKYYAQELIENTYNLTRMNLIMRDILPDNIVVRNNDTLADDWPFFEENDKEGTYRFIPVDAAISNPPYSQPWNTDGADSDPRFSDYGIAPKSKADYAFLLHSLYHLKNDGIMTIVLPHGVLFRGGEEAKIRQKLIENNNIDAIIGMPSNMFFGTGIPTIIMVLKKSKTDNSILFVDASNGFVKDGNKNRLQAKDVKRIVDVVINRENIDGYSRLVEKDEIVSNEYNLNIPRYINTKINDEEWDIYSTMFGGIPNSEIDLLKEYWDAFPSLRKEIFTEKDIPYSEINSDNLLEIINNNEDVKKYINVYNDAFKDFKEYMKEELIDNSQELSIAKEKEIISNNIRDRLKDIPLIDYYDAYQLFDDDWNQISLDLELIQAEGLEAVSKVDKNMIYKKNKDKEIVEVQDGWIGHILPFELIQDIYFSESKTRLNGLVSKVQKNEIKKDNLLNSIDVNDKQELLKDDSDEIESKKLNAVIKKINKELRAGAEFEEDSYESIIIDISKTNDEMKNDKKEIKEIKASLEDETKKKIESLTTDEGKVLLEEKWINPLYNSINQLPYLTIDKLVRELKNLNDKYKQTYKEISINIENSKTELLSELKELTGNEFDMKGIKEFDKILSGDEHGE